MGKVKGGCLCGSVRYESPEEPQMVAVCHCTHCQKSSGSAFSVNLGMAADSVKFTGTPAVYEDKGTSGQPLFRMFCGKCGSSLATDAKAFPGILFVKAGTLDDASWVNPGLEIWTQSAQKWSDVTHIPTKFPGNPG